MNIFTMIKWKLEDIRERLYTWKYKLKYTNYIEDGRHYGSLEHIWGVTSYDDFTGSEANLYTMNDIDITYDRDSKLYMLGIETAYMFKEPKKQNECEYLKELLDFFDKYMDAMGLSKSFDKCLFFSQPTILTSAESIEELYMNFKIFVEGYCKAYGF
ncbi:MAG: hypothetical protein WCU80_10720 [Paludibacteraceae bacterium]